MITENKCDFFKDFVRFKDGLLSRFNVKSDNLLNLITSS